MQRCTLTRVTNAIRSFANASRGNVAMTFAIGALPVIGFVGSGIDYTRAYSAKVAMQNALDAAALMVAKNAASMTPAQMATAAQNYFNANFPSSQANNIVITTSYSTNGGSQILLTGSATVNTNFMGIMGYNTLPINATSTAKWGTSRLRVALALDNTGSMADDGKMDALKTAAKNFIAQMKAAATNNGDVYVSIIPFAKDVNVGTGFSNASWIDWTSWDSANTVCSGFQFGSLCFGSWSTANHNTWNGCVTDRGGTLAPDTNNYDQKVTLPTSAAASKWPAEQYNACPVAMMGLSYDWNALTALIDDMTPQGGTNQPIGLVWAWQSLVGGGPLTMPPKDSGYTYNDVIILMSDGLNTQDRWYGNGSVVSPLVDARMYNTLDGTGTCANAKAAGVTIYAIQVNTNGDPTSTLLQNCASSSDKFSQITSANQLLSTFNTIGTALTKLRIAN